MARYFLRVTLFSQLTKFMRLTIFSYLSLKEIILTVRCLNKETSILVKNSEIVRENKNYKLTLVSRRNQNNQKEFKESI